MKKFLITYSIFAVVFSSYLYSQSNFYDVNTIQEVRISFQEPNWKHILDSLFINYGEEGRLKGDITINGQFFKGVGVRYKGFSSWDIAQTKNPFNVELDYSIKNQNYKGFTKLKLGNIIHDPSFVREVLSYEIARKYMPASMANYAKVFINDTLLGLYCSVEAVDKIFVKKFFNSNINSFFKGSPVTLQYPFGQNANLAYTHGGDTAGYKPFYKQESDISGWSNLLKFIYILNNQIDSIEYFLNTDRTLWMHAFNYSMVNLDSYIGYSQNYYLYMDDNGRFNPILWDLNMSFGSFRNSDGTSLNLTIAKTKQINPLQHLYSSSYSPRPLMKNLFQNATYRKMYIAHLRTIINENFRNNEYFNRAQIIQNIIDAAVLEDSNKFYSYDNFKDNLTITVGPTADQYPGIKDLMEARIAYLDTFPGFSGAPEISMISHQPEAPAKGEQTWITAKIASANNNILAYKYSSRDIFHKTTMFDDGLHHDGAAGDSIYGALLIPTGHTIQYYIYAENDSAGIFSPERAEYEFYSIQPKIEKGDISINEFMSSGNKYYKDQNSEYDPWIEIYNNTGDDLSLKDLLLSNENDIKWQFPDTIIKAHNYLIIWADGDITQSGLHTDFDLSENGGKISLSYYSQKSIDSVVFAEMVSGKTIGRYPNGNGPYVFMNPSFSMNNMVGNNVELDFGIFPNPSAGLVNIEIKNNNNPFSIIINNTQGQTLISANYEVIADLIPVANIKLDLSELVKGIYYVRVLSSGMNITKKLIVY